MSNNPVKEPGFELVSHWNTFIDGFSYSPEEFYKYLKAVVESREIKGVSIDITTFVERSIFSDRRKYLRIRQKGLIYYVGAAHYGQGFYVSSWFFDKLSLFEAILMRIPFIGKGLTRLFYPVTFYTTDTLNVYNTIIHQSIISTVDYITEQGGKRPISEAARKPVMKDFFKR